MSISDKDKAFVKDNRSKAEATNIKRIFGGFFVYSYRVIFAFEIGSGNLIIKSKRQLSQFYKTKAARSLFVKTL